ncbi:hypothetical protein [Natrinema gari]|uniref:Uncharacterized protein n=1 Tax=Natrinema gari JCM 14663 TaxID=1230459 RepID=L9YUI5_9EURY|nr:hypothetical protein [Natrinema gari]ELY77137.1 hypothetical protein C486_16840 [Natrinema gari JCM 14663]
MVRALRKHFLGNQFERNLTFLAVPVIFLGTFTAYAIGLFTVEGGVILLASNATSIGIIIAASVGYRRGGLIAAWVSLFAAYQGFYAEWAFLGLSSHSLTGQLAFLFDQVRLAFAAGASIAFGTIAYIGGVLVHRGYNFVRHRDKSTQT